VSLPIPEVDVEEYAKKYGIKSRITVDTIATTYSVVKNHYLSGSSELAREVVKDLQEALQRGREAFELLFGPYMVALYSICSNTDKKSDPMCPSVVKMVGILKSNAQTGHYSHKDIINAAMDTRTLEKMYRKYKELVQAEEKRGEEKRRLWPFGRK